MTCAGCVIWRPLRAGDVGISGRTNRAGDVTCGGHDVQGSPQVSRYICGGQSEWVTMDTVCLVAILLTLSSPVCHSCPGW